MSKTGKVLIGLALGGLLGGLVGAVIATQPPLRSPDNPPGFNEANFVTALEAGSSIGAFTGAVIALA